MTNVDRYGLSAQYDFVVEKSTFTKMEKVINQVRALNSAFYSTSQTINDTNIARKITKISGDTLAATNKVSSANKQLQNSLKQVMKDLRPLKQEYRAIVNESRNIDWGDLLQPRKFARASREAKRYIGQLSELESQVKGNTAVERAFVAQLKRKQTMMKNNIELQKQERVAAKAAYRIGEARVFRQIGTSVIVPFKRVAADGIKTLAEFDDQMSSVKAVSGATASEMKSLRSEAKRLGASTKFTASQVAEAQGYLAMAGLMATDVLVAQKHALNLAAAGNLELGEAADIASNAMSAFGLEADQVERIANVMAKTASTTNTNVSQLGEAFKFAAPNAKQFGATLEETAALIGIAGNVGIQGSLAGTGARSGFINLTQARKQRALERNFGVSAINEDGTAKNIISIIGELKNALDVDFRDPQFIKDLRGIEEDIANGVEGAEGSLKELSTKYPQYAKGLAGLTDVFGKTAVSFWSAQISQYDQLQKQALVEFAAGVDEKALARQLGIDPSVDLFKQVIAESESYEAAVATLQGGIRELVRTGKGGEGAASAMARIMEQNLAGSFRALGSAIEAFKIAYFEPLKPAIMGIVNTLARFLRFMANLPEPIRMIVSGFGVMVASGAALTVVLASLAGALFTFSKAAGIAAIAQNNLAAGAAIPLTGFFQTSMEGMASTSPITTLSKNYGIFLDDFRYAWRKTLGDSLRGLRFWASKAIVTIQGVGLVARSLLFNPFTMWVGGILLLNALIEQVVPGFNLLGTILGALVAPFGFVYGFAKGFVGALLDAVNLGRSQTFGAIAPIFQSIGNAVTQAIRSFELFSASGERLGKAVGDFLTAPFRAASTTIINLWNATIAAIRRPLQPFADFVRWIGRQLIKFLAENSPGPTFQIRQKWGMTIDYLTGLFGKIIAVAQLVNHAFLGIGDVSQSVRAEARAEIFSGLVSGAELAAEKIAKFITFLLKVPSLIDSAVGNALANLDLFSFMALIASTLPLTLMEQLRATAAIIVPELGLILSTGIPRAIIYALPAAVAYAVSSGAIAGAEAGISRFLDRLPTMFHRVTQKIRDSITPQMKAELNRGISDSLSTIAQALSFEGRVNFDLDQSLMAIDNYAESGLKVIVDYLHEIGEVSRDVGQSIASILQPFLNLKVLPFLPSTIVNFTVLLPLYRSLGEILGSPSLKGSIGFLANTLFPALMRSIQAAAASLGYFLTLVVSAPSLLLAETMEQIFAVISRTQKLVRAFSLTAIVQQISATVVAQFKNLIYKVIPSLLSRIPGVGQAISKTFINVMQILSRFIPRYYRLLVELLPTEVFAKMLASYKNVFLQIGKGIAYAVEEGIAPVAGILLRILNPASALNFIKLYFRTSGFRTIVKSGLFAVNPLDLLFGSKWMEVAIAGMKVFAGMAFPKNIVSSKMSETLQMLADPMARANAIRRSRSSGVGLLVSRLEIYKKSAPPVRILIKLLEGLMIVNPLIQLIGSLAMTMMFWYTVLKPLNNEMILAIGHIEVFNISLMPLAIALKGIRFLIVDLGEALGNMALGTPGAIAKTMHWFDKLGDAIARVVGVTAEITRIILNLSKDLIFDPLFAAIAYPIALGLKLVLVEARNLITFLKNETQAYGDAIVALAHGNIMPLLRQLFYDLMLRPLHLIGHLLDLTVGNVLRGLAAVSRAIFTLGKEIVMLITHPVEETKRLIGLLGTELEKLQEKLSPFTDRLGAVTNFLMNHKALVIAVGVGLARVLGMFTGYTLIVDLMGAVAFLISEYRNGFVILNGLLNAITHPIELLNHLIEGIGNALNFSLPPEFSDVLALVTNSLISAFPIIIAGIFTVGLLLRKNIGQAFSFVIESGMKFVGMIMTAIDAMRDLAFISQKGLNRTPIPIAIAQGLHNVRSRSDVAGFNNPLAYSRDPGMQERAVAMGNNLKMAKELRRYEKAYIKEIKRLEKESIRQMIRQAKYGTAEEKRKIFADKTINKDGRVLSRQPLLEEYTNKLGRKDYRATAHGRMKIRDHVGQFGATGESYSRLAKKYLANGGQEVLSIEKLDEINKDIYDRYRGKQTTPGNQLLMEEVRTGLGALHDSKNLETIQSKFIYADAIHIKSNTANSLTPQNFDSNISGWQNNQSVNAEFRDALTTIPSIDQFTRQVDTIFKSRAAAGSMLDELVDDFNRKTQNFVNSGYNPRNSVESGPSGFEMSASLFKSGDKDIERVIGSRDPRRIAQLKQEIIQHYVDTQAQAINYVAKSQGIDLDALELSNGIDPTIATNPLDILRRGVSNLVDETVSQSRDAERGIIASTKRLGAGFLKLTGIGDWFTQIRQNFTNDDFARKLEKQANYKQFFEERRNRRNRTRRREAVSEQMRNLGVESYGEALGDDRLANILQTFVNTGESRYSRGKDAFATAFAGLGGSFIQDDGKGVDFTTAKRLLQDSMNEQQMVMFRKFIEHGVDSDRGINKRQLESISRHLYQNSNLEFDGVGDARELQRTLEQFRKSIKQMKDADGLVDSNALSDFQAMLGSPKNNVKASKSELQQIIAALEVDSLSQLVRTGGTKNLIQRLKNNTKDFFVGLRDRLDGIDLVVKETTKDIEVYALATDFTRNIYAKVKNFGKPIYEKLSGGLRNGINAAEQSVLKLVDSGRGKLASLATSKLLGVIKGEIIQSQRNMFTSIRRYGGQASQSVEKFTAGFTKELNKAGIYKAVDRAKIAAALIKSRESGQSIEDLLKSQGYDDKLHQINRALADYVKISVDDAEKLLKDPSLSSRLGTPAQIIIAQKIPALALAVGKDLSKVFDATVGRVARGAGRELLVNLGPEVSKDLGRWSKKLHDFVAMGLSKSANVIADVTGDNRFVQSLRKWSEQLFERGMSSADKLFAISRAADSGETTRLRKIFNAAKGIYDSIAERLKGVKTKIDAQGGLWAVVKKTWTSLKKMFTAKKGENIGDRVHRGRQDVARLRTERDLSFNQPNVNVRLEAQRNLDIATARLAEDEQRLQGTGNWWRKFARSLRSGGAEFRHSDDISNVRQRIRQEGMRGSGISNLQAHGTREQAQNLEGVNRMASYSEYRLPKFREFMANMADVAAKTSQEIAVNFSSSARKSGDHWEYTKNKIAGTWSNLWNKAKQAGQRILHHISENSPGPSEQTRQNWQHTENSVADNMQGMANAAESAGDKINSHFSRVSKAVGGFWQTGLMVGSSLSALGMASQTIAYSLSNMGIIEADSELMQAVTNIGELTSIIGALGSVAAPMLSLGISLSGSLVAGIGAIVPLVMEIGTAIATFGGLSTVGLMPVILGIGAIVAGLTALYYAFRTNFLGITSIARGFAKVLTTIFALPIAWVTNAWQAFADKFGGILYPIIEPAVNVAHGLIAALNCHPTERVTEAWHGAVENIQGFLGGLLGFGIGIGQKLSGIFSGIRGVFHHQEKPAQHEEKPAQKGGGLGVMVGAVTAPIKLMFMAIYKAVDTVAGKVAGWIEPLMGKVETIAEFFHSLAVITESIAYIEQVIGPLISKNKLVFESIKALAMTLNSIAVVFDSVDYIMTFLFRHRELNHRTAYKEHTTRAATLGKEPVAESKPASGIKQLVAAGKTFGGMITAVKTIKSNWQETSEFIHSSTEGLAAKTADTGHQLKANLSEASPGPTYWIRINWQKTTDFVGRVVGKMARDTQTMGERMKQGLSFGSVVRGNITEVRRNFVLLGQSVAQFGEEALVAILKLDLTGLSDSATRFGHAFNLSLQGAIAGFKSLTWNTVVFGLASVASLSPVIVALGVFAVSTAVAAFGVAVIVANFLGLRSILKGLFKLIQAIGPMAWGTIQGVAIGLDGLRLVAVGLFKLLQGDVTVLWQGVDRLKEGFSVARGAIIQGLVEIRYALSLIVDGILTGISQVFGVEVAQVKGKINDLWLILRSGTITGDLVAEKLVATFKVMSTALTNLWSKLKSTVVVGAKATVQRVREVISGLFAPGDKSSQQIVDNLKWVFSKQGLAALGLSNPAAGIIAVFENGFAALPDIVKVPLTYIGDFISAFGKRILQELPPNLQEAFALDNIKQQIKSATNFITDNFNRLVAWLNTIDWLPKNLEQLGTAFAEITDWMQGKFKTFIGWLTTTKIVPQGFLFLSKLFRATSNLLGKLEGKVALLRLKLAMRGTESNFVTKLLTGVQYLLGGLRVLTRFSSKVFKSLTKGWLKFRGVIGETDIFDYVFNAIKNGAMALPNAFDTIKQWWQNASDWIFASLVNLEHQWHSFTDWIKTDIAWGEKVAAVWATVKESSGQAIEWIKGAWSRFTERFSSILEPVVEFARNIARKLIGALNCHPTEKIPTAWEKAVDRIGGAMRFLLKPATWTAKQIIGAFKPTAAFLWSIGGGFVAEVVPAMNTVGEAFGKGKRSMDKFIDEVQRGLTATGSARKEIGGLVGAFIRLLEAIAPLKNAFLNMVGGSEQLRQGFGDASSSGERFGKLLGKIVGSLLKFGATVAPGLSKAVVFIARITLELGTFAAKIAWALRYVVHAGLAVGVAAGEAALSIAKFVRSIWQGFLKVTRAAEELKTTTIAAITAMISGIWDFAVAIDKLIMSVLKVKFPRVYQAIATVKQLVTKTGKSFKYVWGLMTQPMQPSESTISFWQVLGDSIGGVIKAIKTVLKIVRIIVFPKEIIEGIAIGIDKMFDLSGMTTSVKNDFQSLFEILEAKLNEVIDTFTKVKERIVNGLQEIRTKFYEILEKFVPALVPVVQKIEKEIIFLKDMFIASITDAMGRVEAMLAPVVGEGLQKINQVRTGIKNLGVDLIEAIVGFEGHIRAFLAEMTGLVKTAFGNLGGEIKQIFIDSKYDLNEFIGFIKASLVGAWSNLKETIYSALAPIPEAVVAARELFTAIEKVGGAVVELGAGFLKFGSQVIGAISDVTAKFGGMVKGLIRLKIKLLVPIGPLGILIAIVNVSKAVIELIGNLKSILTEGIPIFGKLENALSAPAKAVADKWKSTSDKVKGFMGSIADRARTAGREAETGLAENSPGPTFMIRQKWAFAVDFVIDKMQLMGDKAVSIGQEIGRANENSVKRTVAAYQKLDDFQPKNKAVTNLIAQYKEFNGDINKSSAIQRLAGLDNLTETTKARTDLTTEEKQNRLSRLEAVRGKALDRGKQELAQLKQLAAVKQANAKAGQAMQSATMSVGAALSNFAPQLATPLFAAGDLADAYSNLSEAIPDIASALMLKGATSTAVASTEVAANSAVATASATSASIQTASAATAANAEVTAAGIIAGVKATLISWYGTLSATVVWSTGIIKAAWASTSAFILANPIILLIAAAVTGLYLAFKYNFLNINDLISGLMHTLGALISPLITVGSAIFNFYKIIVVGVLGEVWQILKIIGSTIGSILHSIVIGVGNLFLPITQLFNLFFGQGGGLSIGKILGGIANAVVGAVSLITKAVALVGGAIQWVFGLLRPIGMWVGETVMSYVGLLAVFGGIMALITNIGGVISVVVSGLSLLFAPIVSAITFITPAISFIASVIGILGTVALPAIASAIAPIVMTIGAIALVGVILKPIFNLVMAMIAGIVQGVKLVIGETIGAIWSAAKDIWAALQELGNAFVEPFKPLLAIFGGDGSGGGIMLKLMQATVSGVLVSFKIVAFVLKVVVKILSVAIQTIIKLGTVLVTTVLAPFRIVASIINSVFNKISGFVTIIKTLGRIILEAVMNPFQRVIDSVKWIFGKINGLLGGVFGGGKETPVSPAKYAAGGHVTGPGTATSDSIPAMLSNGEFVVNAAAAAKNLGLLKVLNATGYLPTIDLDFARQFGLAKALELAPQAPKLEVPPPPPINLPTPEEINTVNSQGKTELAETSEININFTGDIIIKSETTPEMVKEMLTQLGPQLSLQVKAILREEAARRR